MKNIKIILTTCVVALTVGLIWTGCQKQNPVTNNDIDSSNVNKSKSKQYVVEAYSEDFSANVKATIIDNRNGTIIVNSKLTDKIGENRGKFFILNSNEIITEDGSISVPENSNYWIVDILNDGELQGIRSGGTFIFKCLCNDTNSESPGCSVVDYTPHPDVLIKDCNTTDANVCTKGCRGVQVRTKTVKTKSSINEDNYENYNVGKILIKADKLILNGKIYK